MGYNKMLRGVNRLEEMKQRQGIRATGHSDDEPGMGWQMRWSFLG
jgi:hypothetical protein